MRKACIRRRTRYRYKSVFGYGYEYVAGYRYKYVFGYGNEYGYLEGVNSHLLCIAVEMVLIVLCHSPKSLPRLEASNTNGKSCKVLV